MADMAILMPPRPIPLTVAVDPVGLVITECIAVMSAMRKHPRWAHSSVGAILSGGTEATALGTRRGGPPGSEDASLALDAGWRWGSRSKKGKSLQDNPLMSAFTKLRSELRGCKGAGTSIEEADRILIYVCNRYQGLRYTKPNTSLPPSHKKFLYLCLDHLSRPHSHDEISLLQCNLESFTTITVRFTEFGGRDHTLPI